MDTATVSTMQNPAINIVAGLLEHKVNLFQELLLCTDQMSRPWKEINYKLAKVAVYFPPLLYVCPPQPQP